MKDKSIPVIDYNAYANDILKSTDTQDSFYSRHGINGFNFTSGREKRHTISEKKKKKKICIPSGNQC